MLAPHATVCIDIPIGLSSDGFRACDRAARQLLGKRSSSVFPVPPRLALARCLMRRSISRVRRIVEKGVSKQAFYLLPKIREAEALSVHPTPMTSIGWKRIRSSVSVVLMGPCPWKHTKKTDAGFRERRTDISASYTDQDGRPLDSSNLMASEPRGQCARDDMVDALVCGVVARLDAEAEIVCPRASRSLMK